MTTASDANPLTDIRQRVEAVENEHDDDWYPATEITMSQVESTLWAFAVKDIRTLLSELDRLLTADEANRRLVDELTAALKPFALTWQQFAKDDAEPEYALDFPLWVYEHADDDLMRGHYERAAHFEETTHE